MAHPGARLHAGPTWASCLSSWESGTQTQGLCLGASKELSPRWRCWEGVEKQGEAGDAPILVGPPPPPLGESEAWPPARDRIPSTVGHSLGGARGCTGRSRGAVSFASARPSGRTWRACA